MLYRMPDCKKSNVLTPYPSKTRLCKRKNKLLSKQCHKNEIEICLFLNQDGKQLFN